MSNIMTVPKSDYQKFSVDDDGAITGVGERMAKKMRAIPIPDLTGKNVLDIGCDFGFWSFLSANKGARHVLGLDRGRNVPNFGYCDIVKENRAFAHGKKNLMACWFENMELGKQWHTLTNKYDVIYMFSLYHHVYEAAGG